MTPAAKSGQLYQRARVCIDFVSLNQRMDLTRGRAMAIEMLWDELERERTGRPEEQGRAKEAPHARCGRAFVRRYRSARALLQSKEPSLFDEQDDAAERRRPRGAG